MLVYYAVRKLSVSASNLKKLRVSPTIIAQSIREQTAASIADDES